LLENGEFKKSLTAWNYETGVYWSDNGGTADSGALLLNAPQIETESKIIYEK
jgi:hypothetical protein